MTTLTGMPVEEYLAGGVEIAVVKAIVETLSANYLHDHEDPTYGAGRLIINWGDRSSRGWQGSLLDAETGEEIPNVVRFTVNADVESHRFHGHGLTASVETYTDADGAPLPIGASPVFTDEYRQWIERGMPDGEEPSPQVRSAVFNYLVVGMTAPASLEQPGAAKQVRIVDGDRAAWVDEGLADVVRDMWAAGLHVLQEILEAPGADGREGHLEIVGTEQDAETARGILASHGINVVASRCTCGDFYGFTLRAAPGGESS